METSKNLTNKSKTSEKSHAKLTNKNKGIFKISIEQDLESGYSFKKLNPSGIKKFHSFIEKIAGKNFDYVEKSFKRSPDKKDKIKKDKSNPHCSKIQMIHYGDNTGIRLHGFLKDGYFVLVRVDCNHKYHK